MFLNISKNLLLVYSADIKISQCSSFINWFYFWLRLWIFGTNIYCKFGDEIKLDHVSLLQKNCSDGNKINFFFNLKKMLFKVREKKLSFALQKIVRVQISVTLLWIFYRLILLICLNIFRLSFECFLPHMFLVRRTEAMETISVASEWFLLLRKENWGVSYFVMFPYPMEIKKTHSWSIKKIN